MVSLSRKTKKYHAHDENNEANVGDTVMITWRCLCQRQRDGD